MTETEATWPPGRQRRNIAEIVVQCAYTNNLVRCRLARTKRRDFPLRGNNWFEIPQKLTPDQWHEYVSMLHHEHRELCAAVQAVSASMLAPWRAKVNIVGVTFHDIYHAGQIRTIRALWRNQQ